MSYTDFLNPMLEVRDILEAITVNTFVGVDTSSLSFCAIYPGEFAIKTTVAAAIVAGTVWVEPASMWYISAGTRLKIQDVADPDNTETVVVLDTTATEFQAAIVNNYPDGDTIILPGVEILEDNLPFAVLQQAINEPVYYGRQAHGRARLYWKMAIDLYLAPYPTNDIQSAAAEHLSNSWLPDSIGEELYKYQTLNGTVARIGDGRPTGRLFDYQIAGMSWGSRSFWGARILVPVKLTNTTQMSN